MDAVIFYICGFLSVVAALLVVTRRNPVYSAIFLVLFFTAISVDFLILGAPFLAVIQVLVYAGAIMVLFLFVIMLLNLSPEELKENVSRRRKAVAAVGAVVLFAGLATAISTSPTVQESPGAANLLAPVTSDEVRVAGETEGMASSLFTEHVLPFELTSILIIVAIIGAIYLTKSRRASPSAESDSAEGARPDGQGEAPGDTDRRPTAQDLAESRTESV